MVRAWSLRSFAQTKVLGANQVVGRINARVWYDMMYLFRDKSLASERLGTHLGSPNEANVDYSAVMGCLFQGWTLLI